MNLAQAVITKEPLEVISADDEMQPDFDEKSIVVVRNGKKIRKNLKRRPKRKKIRTASQRAASKRGARKRRTKQAAINRKRARSNKKRVGLKTKDRKFKIGASYNEDVKLATKLLQIYSPPEDDTEDDEGEE